MAFAKIALEQIEALHQPATPLNYAVWYTYATGHNRSLNQTINEILSRNGTLTAADLEQAHASYISPMRVDDKIGSVSSRFAGEISQVMATIDAAAGSAGSHTESLTAASNKLSGTNDRDGLRTIVASLLETASKMKQSTLSLETRLRASKQEIDWLQETLQAVRNECLTDPLTGLANRKDFDDRLALAVANATQRGEPLSLMMIDLDDFKSFNDAWGHLTGDRVLCLVALALKHSIKDHDFAARYGGEEFAVILPNAALRSALNLAEQVRRAVMSKDLIKKSTGQNLGRVTISLGVATSHKGDTVQSLITRADACLYAAKRNGRNRVICETDPEVAATPNAKVA